MRLAASSRNTSYGSRAASIQQLSQASPPHHRSRMGLSHDWNVRAHRSHQHLPQGQLLCHRAEMRFCHLAEMRSESCVRGWRRLTLYARVVATQSWERQIGQDNVPNNVGPLWVGNPSWQLLAAMHESPVDRAMQSATSVAQDFVGEVWPTNPPIWIPYGLMSCST